MTNLKDWKSTGAAVLLLLMLGAVKVAQVQYPKIHDALDTTSNGLGVIVAGYLAVGVRSGSAGQ